MPWSSPHAVLNIAAGGLLAGQAYVDVISANIANVNTNGYKRARLDFQELLTRLNGGDMARTGVWPAQVTHLFEQGALRSSANPLDLAIEGEGFFMLRLPDGRTAYTRDGSFHRDANGTIVNADGFPLIYEGGIPEGALELHVNPDGSLMARVETANGQEWQQVGTIRLARFINPAGLLTEAHNLFLPTAASGAAQVGTPGQEGLGEIIGGALEGSNTDLSQAMTELIIAQRSYALSLRALQQADEMLALAVQLRR